MRDMLGREDAVTVHEAQRRIAEYLVIKTPPVVRCDIADSYGRILAEDLFSPEEMPAFPRSTVDGFAVRASDTFGATEGIPAYLRVTHEIFMGKAADFSLVKGSAAKIPTGGMLPHGADAVVMFEYTQSADETTIEVLKPVAPMENVIAAGEDVRKGELILKRGSRLRPQDVAALAGVGVTEVAVYEKPRVAIISTGDEIVPSGHPLKPGQVRDVNSFNLAGLIMDHGGVPVKKGIFRDDYGEIRDVLLQSLKEAEIGVITGGSSVGTQDMTAKVIQSVGTPGVLFHGVTLKPGKPTIGGIVQGIPVFGLPGHPAAVTVCFELFIAPVLRRLTGVTEKEHITKKKTLKARIAKNISSSAGREEHIRVALEEREGELWAVPVLGKSGLIRTFVLADGIVIIPAQMRGIPEGETVEVLLF